MSMLYDLRAFIIEDATVAELLGYRLYPVVLPQAAEYPAATYQTISTQGGHTMAGPDGLDAVRVQIDCYSPLDTDVRSVASAIRNRIDGFRGVMGTTEVQGVFFDDERAAYHAEPEEPELHRVGMDFMIWAQRT